MKHHQNVFVSHFVTIISYQESLPISKSPARPPSLTSSLNTSLPPSSPATLDKSGSPGSFQPQKLEHEFSLLNKSIPNVTIERVRIACTSLCISAYTVQLFIEAGLNLIFFYASDLDPRVLCAI